MVPLGDIEFIGFQYSLCPSKMPERETEMQGQKDFSLGHCQLFCGRKSEHFVIFLVLYKNAILVSQKSKKELKMERWVRGLRFKAGTEH